MAQPIQQGATGKTIRIRIRDSSTGQGKTGLTYATAGLVIAWAKNGDASATLITLVAGTAGTWVSGGFRELDATKAKGAYDLDIPDAAFANADEFTSIHWSGTGILDDGVCIDVPQFDPLGPSYFDQPQPEQTTTPPIDGSTGADRLNYLFHDRRNPQYTTDDARVLTQANGETDPTTGTPLTSWVLSDDGTRFVEKPA